MSLGLECCVHQTCCIEYIFLYVRWTTCLVSHKSVSGVFYDSLSRKHFVGLFAHLYRLCEPLRNQQLAFNIFRLLWDLEMEMRRQPFYFHQW